MPFFLALYVCARGHRHRITVPRPPAELEIAHGQDIGKPPSCRSLLHLQSKEEVG